MSPRDWIMRIEDILEAIDKIRRYTRGLDPAGFAADEMAVDAVVRNLIIIGEAARHIPAEVTGRYPEVPWTRLRGMRNLVVHEYFGVDISILWDTVQEDLPPLVHRLRRILEAES